MKRIFFLSGCSNSPSKLIMEYKRYVQRNNHYLDFPAFVDEEGFIIVFDVSSLEENELAIELIEENKLKVSLKHGLRDNGNIRFSRDCTYVYELPENVEFTNLIAHWSGDNFLVIKEEKSIEAKGATKFEEDPDGQESNLEEAHNSAKNGTKEKIKQATTVSNNSKSEEGLMKDLKSTSSVSEQRLSKQEIKPVKIRNEKEEKVMQDDKSTNLASESRLNVLHEKKLTNVSSKCGKEKIQEGISEIASSESGNIIIQEMKSPEKPKMCIEELMRKDESMDTFSARPKESRLIPKRVHNLILEHIISVGDLQVVMNEVEKRIKFVNQFLDKHSFE